MNNDLLLNLDRVADMLQNKGLLRYASSVDALANSVQMDAPDLNALRVAAEDLSVNDPKILQTNMIIHTHLDNDSIQSTIRDVIGDVAAPNKAALLDFISKVETLGKLGKPLTDDDNSMLADIDKALATQAPDDC